MSRNSMIKSASAEVALKNPLRRTVRIQARNGDQIIAKTKSFTQRSGAEYHPAIDCTSFEFHCDCKDHECRKRACKHIKRLALGLIRRGDLPAVFLERAGLECCHHCGGSKSLYPMCGEDGTRMDGVFICAHCIADRSGKAATPQEVSADAEDEAWEMAEEPLNYVEESRPDEARPSVEHRRAEIEQMRRGAEHLDLHGGGVSAASLRRAADHHERLLETEIASQSEATEGDEDDYGFAAMVSNCPCGRSFRGVDFDHVCPSCRVTLREAWRRHRSHQVGPGANEAHDDPFADSATFVPVEAARGFAFYHQVLAL